MENKKPKIIIIGGKARTGKDVIIDCLKKQYKEKIIVLKYSFYIKEYAKNISDWDGSEETKPRELLQQLGTDIIRTKIDDKFFINRMIEDIKVYSFFFDYILIGDARFIEEIEDIKNTFDNIITVRITRPNFDNGLTEKQKNHPTEVGLDNYELFDYKIINDGILDDLKLKVERLIEVINNES